MPLWHVDGAVRGVENAGNAHDFLQGNVSTPAFPAPNVSLAIYERHTAIDAELWRHGAIEIVAIPTALDLTPVTLFNRLGAVDARNGCTLSGHFCKFSMI